MHWLDVYDVAHYCMDCQREYSHSQGAWEEMKQNCLSPYQPHDHRMVTCETKRLTRDDTRRERQWRIISHLLESRNKLTAGKPKEGRAN